MTENKTLKMKPYFISIYLKELPNKQNLDRLMKSAIDQLTAEILKNGLVYFHGPVRLLDQDGYIMKCVLYPAIQDISLP